MNEFEDALPSFIAEARELLEAMEAALLAYVPGKDDSLAIDEIFRAAHTIKGSAGLFGLQAVVDFTHDCESVLDRVRDGGLAFNAELASLLLLCGDHLRHLVDLAADQGSTDDLLSLQAAGAPLQLRLRAALDGRSPADVDDAPPAPGGAAAAASAAATGGHWHLSLRFGRDVLRHGMDPLSLIRYLGTLGTLLSVQTVLDALPPVEDFDAESCYLGFEIALRSDADKARIDSAFDFVRDDCEIRILPPHSRVQDFVQLIHDLPGDDLRLGELLVRCGSVTQHELQQALRAQSNAAEDGLVSPLGEILVAQEAAAPEVVKAALAKQAQVRETKAAETRLIRVDADKLDRLIDLVGELITSAASADIAARRSAQTEVQEANAELLGLVEEVRDSAMNLRMVKIGATFGKFHRVVYDVAREIGKDIALVLSGEDTELDKSVVERIGDPLMHLVRNAMDHGIEPPALRRERGKPERGTLSLNAYHDAGSIVIEVGDDGGGLDRDRILAKAQQRGLVEPGATLADDEIYNLIFEPGFSTAEQVTNLSGRGVGMDVVRSNITALRGNVAIRSTPGQGTTMEIRLPLTMAIIHGFQVAVGNSVFVIPLEMVEECISHTPSDGKDLIKLRGAALPFARLHDVFPVPGPRRLRQSIVVVRHLGRRAGLVVDALLGESQTVIKPLGSVFRQVEGISGSSVLGSGEVALIVDVPHLLQRLYLPQVGTLAA